MATINAFVKHKSSSAVCFFLMAILCLFLTSCGEKEQPPVDQPYVSATDIIINEVLASNTESIPAYDGRYYDWVELYNPLDKKISLDEYYISDDSDNPHKCSLSGQVIPAKGYLIVYCSGLNITDERGYLHTNFKLSAAKGETVCLSDSHGVSSLNVPACDPNVSFGLNDGKPMRLDEPTPGAPNSAGTSKSETGIVINEFMTSNTYTIYDCEGDYGDWVELCNMTNSDVDLGGYALTDDTAKPFAFVFPEKTVLPSGGCLLVFCDGKNKTDAQGVLHTGFCLSTDDRTLSLFSPERSMVDSVDIPEMPDNISCGRAKGEKSLCFFARPTPGKPNDTPWTKLSAGLTPDINDGVLISEVMSASSTKKGLFDKDYLEIFNSTPSDINLKGYALLQNVHEAFFTFPDITLPSGNYLTVYCDGTEKKAADNLHAPIKISTGGEQFYLADASGKICDVFASGKCRAGMSSGRPGNDTSRRVFFSEPTPGATNSRIFYKSYTPVPSFNICGGIVEKGTAITLTAPKNCVILYTLDGSAPTERSSVYHDKIVINENTVIRAAALCEGCAISDCVTQTYLIENPHSIPIVCVSGSPAALIRSNGILQTKDNNTEVPVHVEFFDENYRKAVEFDCGTQHVGKKSLTEDQRALKLLLREVYGQKTVSYHFFTSCNSAPTTFSSLLLRPSGQDQDRGKMRDELIASILRGQNILDYQEVRPCALYVDAKYWGLYYLREPINNGFIENHYGLERGNYDLIRGQFYVQEGNMNAYNALTDYCEKNDLTNPECYKYICSVVDIDSLINFWILETYFNNPDTDNIRCFKAKDGKWKWIPFDLDLCMYSLFQIKEINYIQSYLLSTQGHGFSHRNNVIIRKLLQNTEFRDRFITLYCWHIDHTFAPERTVAVMERLAEEIDGEMKLNQKRWGYPSYNEWRESGPETLRSFLEQKPAIAKKQLCSSFNLTEEQLAAYCSDTPPEGVNYN